MREDKEIATSLRRQGKSYKEIRSALKIPLSTLSDWFGETDWSREISRKLSNEVIIENAGRLRELNKIRGDNLDKAYEEARQEAREEFKRLKYHPLFVAGMMLYWGEGRKNPDTGPQLANSDADLVRLYVLFLKEICRVPEGKIKAHLLLYPDLEDMVCRAYWAKKTGVLWKNFTKSARMKERHGKRRINWGICVVTVSSSYLQKKVIEWLKLTPQELMNRGYYASIAGSSEHGT